MSEQSIPVRPPLSKAVAKVLRPLNSFFDYFYHSEYNPFYRSGTLAIGLLFVLLVTGFYLLLFYDVASPYASVVAIQEQVWLGRWIRALHRYATDAVLIAVFFHVLHLMAQGKTWGPRTLAWISGVVLLLSLFISAWTGYVMVWDRHGQVVVEAGAKVLRVFPFLRDELGTAFSGRQPLASSFFFMNLFLHVAVPLGMVFCTWVHTARLARTVWFPIRPVFYGSLFALILMSLALPAVLLPEANLLGAVGRTEADWFFGFWMPIINTASPEIALWVWVFLLILGLSLPWWWRPLRAQHGPVSEVNVDTCTGCTQCALDCPYEAIRMIPHPEGKHLLAEVSKGLCVSCGICTASCDVFAIGPAGRAGLDQMKFVEQFLAREASVDALRHIVIICCNHNDGMGEFAKNLADKREEVHYFPINCCGTIHSTALERILEKFGAVLLLGCAARNCSNRDGLTLVSGRLFSKRVPFLDKKIDRRRIDIAPHSPSERAQVAESVNSLLAFVSTNVEHVDAKRTRMERGVWFVKRTIATGALMCLIACFSQFPMGEEAHNGLLRVIVRLPSAARLKCRAATSDEFANLPQHMRQREVCEQVPLSYQLRIRLDDSEVFSKELSPRGLRAERPIFVAEEIEVPPGERMLEVSILPADGTQVVKGILEHRKLTTFSKGQIELVSLGEL